MFCHSWLILPDTFSWISTELNQKAAVVETNYQSLAFFYLICLIISITYKECYIVEVQCYSTELRCYSAKLQCYSAELQCIVKVLEWRGTMLQYNKVESSTAVPTFWMYCTQLSSS